MEEVYIITQHYSGKIAATATLEAANKIAKEWERDAAYAGSLSPGASVQLIKIQQ